jgi:hypothetical protein
MKRSLNYQLLEVSVEVPASRRAREIQQGNTRYYLRFETVIKLLTIRSTGRGSSSSTAR